MDLIVRMLPLALAIAFSSVPILAALMILLSPNAKRSAVPFLIGFVAGMFAVVSLCTVFTQLVPSARLPRREDHIVGQFEIVVGIALVLLGLFALWRSRRSTEHSIPDWLKSTEKLGPWSAFGLALLLNIRPKSLLIAVAAGLTLRADAQSVGEAIVALAVYTAIGASTVAIPIIAAASSPQRVQPRLVRGREWLVRNGEVVASIILLLIGVLVIGAGFERL
ncbi:GAP family protein [Microbacterium sp. B2969]|uniref:GAP family protein n=1 Tax=Microbacterium alkaliflavum TaxID=3248839 RepID=A0ABW7QCS3_9MICO